MAYCPHHGQVPCPVCTGHKGGAKTAATHDMARINAARKTHKGWPKGKPRKKGK